MDNYKIIDGKILTPYRVLENCELCFSCGKIDSIGARNQFTDEAYQIISAKGQWVSPGFIDMHTHGGGGSDFMDATIVSFLCAATAHARHGTTSIVPTALSGSMAETLNFLRTFAEAKALYPCTANLLGVHLEGPYFSKKQCGAQDPQYITPPNDAQYSEILGFSPYILCWSFAPELAGSDEFIRALKKRGVLPSIGHSDAVYEEVMSAFEQGATHCTHLFSCMSTITRQKGYRHTGLLESAMMIDEMTVELIADGRHVPRELLNWVYKTKSADKIALVTDSMRAAGTECHESTLGSLKNGQRVIIEDQVAKLPDRSAFAGSVATMDRLVRVMNGSGIPLTDCVRMASSTPAKILGLQGKGVLARGKDADIVIFDSDINICQVIIGGKSLSLHEEDA